ncbi:hypothetical protein ACWC9R_32065 [Streptomyces sp. NPDC001219]
MQQSMALAKGARITGGAFCLLFFLFTATWLVVDLSQLGIVGLWESWTFQNPGATNKVTSAFHLGLALVQLAAAFTAFAGQRVAGGLLAVATTLTFATVLQAMISVGSHTENHRWFQHAERGTATFDNVFLSSLGMFPLTVIAGIVLLAGMRSWPRQKPSDPPMRPAGKAGVAGGLVLGAMALLLVVWHGYMLVEGGSEFFAMFYFGKGGGLGALLGMAAGWSAFFFLALTVPAVLSSLMRGPAARGLAIGLAVVSLPGAVLSVIGMAINHSLFELSGAVPGMDLINQLQLALDLFGSVALLVLMGRGEPVAPAWYPPSQAPRFAVPGFVPQPGMQAPPVWQPPAGPVPPVSGPPMPPAGAPPMPPGTPPPPQGGFGPPQY